MATPSEIALGVQGGGGSSRRRGGRRRQGQRLGDRLPTVPNVMETPTGIASPAAVDALQARIDEHVAISDKSGDWGKVNFALRTELAELKAQGSTEAGLAQGLVDATTTQSQAEFESEQGLQEEAVGFKEGVEGQVSATGERIEGIQEGLETDKDLFNARLGDALDNLGDMPAQIATEFDRLRDRFGTVASAALADIDAKAESAAEQAMAGRSAAMEAAVQGIQGNINSQVSQIMSNPDLSSAQKQSMVTQVRMAGASAMAPAIGANILQFNTLAADIATKFGSFTAQIQTQVISEEGAFGRAGGQAFAQATVASQEITSNLLGIQATSNASYANAQANLEGIRTQAEMSGNELLLSNLPNLREPVLNTMDSAATAMLLGTDLITRNFERESIGFQQELTIAMIRSQVGTPGGNILNAIMQGFMSGGPMGALMGGGMQLFQGMLNPSPRI